MSAVSHEIRNLSGAALVMHQNLTRVSALEQNEDFEALGTLIQGMEKLSNPVHCPASRRGWQVIELTSTLDQIRILIESACREANAELSWEIGQSLPIVWADRYGLVQASSILQRIV